MHRHPAALKIAAQSAAWCSIYRDALQQLEYPPGGPLTASRVDHKETSPALRFC